MGAIGRSLVWFLIGALLASAGWLAAEGWHRRGAETDPRVLRSYNVKPELAGEISGALNSALQGSGQAGIGPNGQVWVLAPQALQVGVERLVSEVASHNPPATPSIHVEAWLVTASAGPPTDSPELKEIAPALRTLEQSRGPSRFELLEKLSTQARPGEPNSVVQGLRGGMAVGVSVLRDSQDHPMIAARLSLHSNPGPAMINSQTELRPGELLVLGQGGYPDKGITERQLYYIVRATL